MARNPLLLLSLSLLTLASCGGSSGASASASEAHKHAYDEIKVTKDADWRTYLVDADFDPSGMEVSLHCSDCDEWVVAEDFKVTDGGFLPLEKESVTISAGGLTLDYPIKVKEELHIACVGDSLTKGHMWPNESYPTYLSKKVSSSFKVGNFGENGISVTGYGGSWNDPNMKYSKQHFYADSIAFEPDIFAFMLGTNDATGWANAEESFEDEYHALLDSYIEALPFAKFIMMVSPPTKDGNQFGIPNDVIRDYVNPIQRELAEEYGFEVLDLREEFEATENYESLYLRPNNDGVHFTKAAADYVASRVWEITEDMVPYLEAVE